MKNVKKLIFVGVVSFLLSSCTLPFLDKGKDGNGIHEINIDSGVSGGNSGSNVNHDGEGGSEGGNSDEVHNPWIQINFQCSEHNVYKYANADASKILVSKDLIKEPLSFNDQLSHYEFIGFADKDGKIFNDPLEIDVSSLPPVKERESTTISVGEFNFNVEYDETLKYFIQVHLVFEKQDYQFKVEYRDDDETVLYTQYVKPKLDQYNHLIPATSNYLAKTPKKFSEDGPVKFTGFDVSTKVVLNDIVAHATYVADDNMKRVSKELNLFGYNTLKFDEEKYVSLIHNSTLQDIEFTSYHYNSKCEVFTLKAGETRFFDVTEAISKIVSSTFQLKNSAEDQKVIIDYYKNYTVEPVIDSYEAGTSYRYKIPDNKDVVVIPGYGYEKTSRYQVPIEEISVVFPDRPVKVIVLSGAKNVRFVPSSLDNEKYFKVEVEIPNTCKKVTLENVYEDEIKNYDGSYYYGNKSNPFLLLMSGDGQNISPATEIINRFTNYNTSDSFVVPSSVREIGSLNCGGKNVIFEDASKIEKIKLLSNIKQEVYYLPKFNFAFDGNMQLSSCEIAKLYVDVNSNITGQIFSDCKIAEFDVYGELTSNKVHVAIKDGSLYSSDFKTLIRYKTLTEPITYIDNTTVNILENAFERSDSFDKKEIYIPSSVINFGKQSESYDSIMVGHISMDLSKFGPDVYYGQKDGERFIKDGLVYAINRDKGAVIINSINDELSADLVIPDTIDVDGVTYPVKVIAERAFKEKDFNSITFGENLTIVETESFYFCNVNNSLEFPRSMKKIHDLPHFTNPNATLTVYAENLISLYCYESYCLDKITFIADDKSQLLNMFDTEKNGHFEVLFHDYTYTPDGHIDQYLDLHYKFFVNLDGEEICFNDFVEGTFIGSDLNYGGAFTFFPNLKKVHFIVGSFKVYNYSATYCKKYKFGAMDIKYTIDQIYSVAEEKSIEADVKVNYTKEQIIEIIEDEGFYYFGEQPNLLVYEDGVFYINSNYPNTNRIFSEPFTFELLDGSFTIKMERRPL